MINRLKNRLDKSFKKIVLYKLKLFYYESKEKRGLYVTHNIMNYLQTTDPQYVTDTKQVLDKQLANSSLISVVNEKERNNYFFEFEKTINMFRKKIEADIEFNS